MDFKLRDDGYVTSATDRSQYDVTIAHAAWPESQLWFGAPKLQMLY